MYILIGGQPGTGKTTLAQNLSRKFNALYLSTDNLKMFARAINSADPFISTDSHSAWEKFGRKTPANIIKGYRAHNQSLEKLLLAVIKQAAAVNKHLIIEGVQVTPAIYRQLTGEKLAVYLDLPQRKVHTKIFAKKNSARINENTLWNKNYDAITLINGHAKAAASVAGFTILQHQTASKLTKIVINKIRL